MEDRTAEFRLGSGSVVRLGDLAQLVRAPAALSVPGDILAGAAAAGNPLDRRVFGAIGSSVCLYWAGMALNDYADATVDAVERPGRPVPSGRIPRRTAFAVAKGLTAAGLGLAALTGGRRGLVGALPLTGLIWAYDLGLKSSTAGAATMAAARTADVLAGALAGGTGSTGSALRRGAVPAALVGAHTYTLMALSRHEISGAPARVPATTLAASTATVVATALPAVRALCRTAGVEAVRGVREPSSAATPPLRGVAASAVGRRSHGPAASGLVGRLRAKAVPTVTGMSQPAAFPTPPAKFGAAVAAAGALAYLGSYGAAQVRAVREPSGANLQRAVGAGVLGLVPLQAALAARAGAPVVGAVLGVVHPLARRLARRISPT
ncbi:SCO3242 family prenyltransferase [Streptomyces sp. NPDC047072]|uniref:SCO3242 family prenyltransferase n=1 Tax=Streptomyces sp. NPDC047072 TaxID=3154809 RepID=UPI0033C9F94C